MQAAINQNEDEFICLTVKNFKIWSTEYRPIDVREKVAFYCNLTASKYRTSTSVLNVQRNYELTFFS